MLSFLVSAFEDPILKPLNYAYSLPPQDQAALTMHIAQLPLHLQLKHTQKAFSENKNLLLILKRAPSLNLPNWYLAAGALSQTIWNKVSSLPPETGIRDYDLVYHDDLDLSYEAEDAVIQAGKQLFADLPVEVEIRNQARVHLCFEKKFRIVIPPHPTVEAGIDSWISTTAMIGVRIENDGEWSIYAPRGLSDFYNMIARPNPTFSKKENYEKKANRWKAIWKDLTIEPWPEKQSL